jgi:excisionase family DNA binding protein
MPYKTYLTGAEVAKRLAVSPKTVARWAKEGKLAHLRTLGGHRRYDRQMVDRLAQQLTQPTQPTQPTHTTGYQAA